MWNTRDFPKETNFNRKKEEYYEVLDDLKENSSYKQAIKEAKDFQENSEKLESLMKEMLFGIYKNKKSGNKYIVNSVVLDATNDREGNIVVVYIPEGNILEVKMIYCRDYFEFCEKFERVGTANLNLG
jgi:hypothetical protein